MVTAEDMGNESLEIVAVGYMPSEYSDKGGSYYEFSIQMGHTDLVELTTVFSKNWSSDPVEVLWEPQMEVTDVTGGQWIVFEFDQPFMYNGSSALLYDLRWIGPVDPVFERIYAMSWEDNKNSALVAVSPDSSSGYVTNVVPNLQFLTTQALENTTFAGIKSSF